MKTDLHIHSTASDGTWAPEKLVSEVKKNDIRLFSVTDHDSVANTAEVEKLAKAARIMFIPGVEISASLKGNLFHILGYGIDPLNPALLELLRHNSELMVKKDDDSIKMLLEEGHDIDFENYLAYENDVTRGGWKALNFLIDTGICRDPFDFFNHLFKGIHLVFPVFPSPREVIEVINEAGGIPVLAHPAGNLFRKQNLETVLADILKEGIQGVETFHPEHNQEQSKFCYDWCVSKGLFISGGSDCHGEFIKDRRLGMPEIRKKQLWLGDVIK